MGKSALPANQNLCQGRPTKGHNSANVDDLTLQESLGRERRANKKKTAKLHVSVEEANAEAAVHGGGTKGGKAQPEARTDQPAGHRGQVPAMGRRCDGQKTEKKERGLQGFTNAFTKNITNAFTKRSCTVYALHSLQRCTWRLVQKRVSWQCLLKKHQTINIT